MTTKLTRRQFTAASLATAGLLSTGLPLTSARATTRKLKVGVLLPTSGHQAQIGQSCKRGADLAPQILKELYGIEVELLFGDTESKVDAGRNRAADLINRGADVLVGAFDSGVTGAAVQVSEKHGVPFVINVASDPKITEQGYKSIFRNFPTGDMLVANGMQLIKDLFAWKVTQDPTFKPPETAAFMYSNDTFGASVRAGVEGFMAKNAMPFTIVESLACDPKAKDLSSEIMRVKNSGAQLLLPAISLNTSILMIRECIKKKYQPQGIISPGSQGMYELQFYKLLNKYSEFCITNTAWYNPASPVTQMLRNAFSEKFSSFLFELNVVYTFDAILIAADAFSRTQESCRESLTQALRETNIPADKHVVYGGPVTFEANGQNLNLKSASLQNLRAEALTDPTTALTRPHKIAPTVIFPSEIQEATPVYPMPAWGKRKAL